MLVFDLVDPLTNMTTARGLTKSLGQSLLVEPAWSNKNSFLISDEFYLAFQDWSLPVCILADEIHADKVVCKYQPVKLFPFSVEKYWSQAIWRR